MSIQPSIPKKSLGQHWLNDRTALEAMCDAAEIAKGDVVLEIGPGHGTLTERLVARGTQVIALEYDASLVPGLHKKFGDRVLIEHADVRSYDLNEVAPDYKLVANIPYYLTSYLIQMLSESTNPPIKAALLIQKEVAERVAAAPGAMSLLSVTAQFYWQVKLGEVVPPYLFTPPPKVNSQILILKRPAHPRYPGVQPKAYFRLVRAGFSQRRKTLLNALGSGLQASREETGALLQAAGLNPQLRPQNLSLDDWHRLYLAQAAKQLEKKA